MMEVFAADVTSIFLDRGILGALVVVLAGVVIFLYRKCETLQTKIDTVQEERLKNAIETRDKLAEPMEQMTKLIQNILNVVTDNGRK